MHTLLLLAAVYGTLTTNEPPQLVHAPYSSCVDTIVTTNDTRIVTNCVWKATASLDEPTANRLGWKLVLDEPPAPPTNHYAVATGWEYREVEVEEVQEVEEVEEVRTSSTSRVRIYRTYAFEPIVVPPRVYYRYDVSQACYENGFLDSLMQYIESDQYIKWFWNCSNKVEEGNPMFIDATNRVIQSGVDEALVKRILDRAWELGQTTNAALVR